MKFFLFLSRMSCFGSLYIGQDRQQTNGDVSLLWGTSSRHVLLLKDACCYLRSNLCCERRMLKLFFVFAKNAEELETKCPKCGSCVLYGGTDSHTANYGDASIVRCPSSRYVLRAKAYKLFGYKVRQKFTNLFFRLTCRENISITLVLFNMLLYSWLASTKGSSIVCQKYKRSTFLCHDCAFSLVYL